MYQHHNWQGALLDYPVSKVVCVGSNYAKHIKEMGSATPEEPVLFIKPETALCDIRQPLALPQDFGSVHHEVELAVLIGATLRQATEEHVRKAIAGYGVALDLTLRDLQAKMKKAGQPWEKAKGFDNSCRSPVLFRRQSLPAIRRTRRLGSASTVKSASRGPLPI
jgi:2-keto-4-pentenoate hydratase/2-oxohepta-3-ene-1,7-dioic acid hydratase in catechol pathway